MATSDDPEQRAWNAMVPPGRPGERRDPYAVSPDVLHGACCRCLDEGNAGGYGSRRSPGRPAERWRPNHDRVFVGADNGAGTGTGTGADAGAAVTILSNFSSSGLKTNSLSCGVSMAWTQTCRLTPMSPR